MNHHVPEKGSRIVAHAKLSSRSPASQHDTVVEYQRRYPTTTVILPPKLQSESCTSLVSAWDIEREEGEEDEVEIIDGPDGWTEELEEKRAPLAQFRRCFNILLTLNIFNLFFFYQNLVRSKVLKKHQKVIHFVCP